MSESITTRELFQRYITFIGALFIIALGVSLTIRADLGSSPISVLPYIWSMAHGVQITVLGSTFAVPKLTLGQYTICMHVILILAQIVLLRKKFKKIQLLQIVAGIIFGFFIDFTMLLTFWFQWGDTSAGVYIIRFVQMIVGGSVLGFGIACEVRCNALVLPGEGFPIALAQVLHADFGKVKIFSDTGFVVAGVAFCYLFFGAWQWKMVGIGTLISMVYVGVAVRFFSPRIGWLDFLLLDHRNLKVATPVPVTSPAMATPLVITIAREYGSGGHEIGEKLATQLGIKFYDRNIIDYTAEELGLKPEFVKEKEQKITNSKLLELIITDKQIPMDAIPSENDAIFVTQSRIIRNIAANDPCVIIGRCADYILKDNPNCLNVFVLSDIDFAKKRIVAECNLPSEEAEKKILHTNHARANHYWQYTGQKWNDARHYDLVINSSSLGIDRAVNVIAEAVKSRIKK